MSFNLMIVLLTLQLSNMLLSPALAMMCEISGPSSAPTFAQLATDVGAFGVETAIAAATGIPLPVSAFTGFIPGIETESEDIETLFEVTTCLSDAIDMLDDRVTNLETKVDQLAEAFCTSQETNSEFRLVNILAGVQELRDKIGFESTSVCGSRRDEDGVVRWIDLELTPCTGVYFAQSILNEMRDVFIDTAEYINIITDRLTCGFECDSMTHTFEYVRDKTCSFPGGHTRLVFSNNVVHCRTHTRDQYFTECGREWEQQRFLGIPLPRPTSFSGVPSCDLTNHMAQNSVDECRTKWDRDSYMDAFYVPVANAVNIINSLWAAIVVVGRARPEIDFDLLVVESDIVDQLNLVSQRLKEFREATAAHPYWKYKGGSNSLTPRAECETLEPSYSYEFPERNRDRTNTDMAHCVAGNEGALGPIIANIEYIEMTVKLAHDNTLEICGRDPIKYCNSYGDLKNEFCGGSTCWTPEHRLSCQKHLENNAAREILSGGRPFPSCPTGDSSPVVNFVNNHSDKFSLTLVSDRLAKNAYEQDLLNPENIECDLQFYLQRDDSQSRSSFSFMNLNDGEIFEVNMRGFETNHQHWTMGDDCRTLTCYDYEQSNPRGRTGYCPSIFYDGTTPQTIPVLLLSVSFDPTPIDYSKEGPDRNRYTFTGSTYAYDQGNTLCASGILSGHNGVCCNQSCGGCGGSSCASYAGGEEQCCHGPIISNARNCTSSLDTACVLPSRNCNWQCYLDRYSDLQRAFGATNVVAAQQHWKSNGYREGRDCTC